MVAAVDSAETAGAALVHMREPAGILFLVYQNVVGLPGPQAMKPDLHRAVVVVELYIEEALGARAPPPRAVVFLDDIVEVCFGSPLAHTDGKIFRALDIGTPGLEPVVRRMPRAAELEIFLVCRQRIAIEHDLGLAAIPRYAPERFMLAAFAEFAHIGKGAIRRRHAGIVFLDASAQLTDQLLLQRRGMAEQALGIDIFRFEIVSDITVEDRGLARHVVPHLVLQPLLIVDPGP